MGLQELENIGVLGDLAAQEPLAAYDYQPFLIEGADSRGIDVDYLVRADRATVEGVAARYEFVEPLRPYSYIYEGVSETLDHLLLTAPLYDHLVRVEVLHVDADYPPPLPDDPSASRVSDHDPVIAVFAVE